MPASRRAIAWGLRPQNAPFAPFADYDPAPLLAVSRLRDYTLHYHQRVTAAEAVCWIDSNPPASRPAWEPYPLSLRIVNWVKRLDRPSDRILASLAVQADYLSRTVEHHLLANHLFVNAKALVFAGVFLCEDRWLRQGLQILEREIPEQVLMDGGHYERSPMYHSLILEDLLDLVNLGRAYPGLLPDFAEPATRMLIWLDRMTHPDGEIAFFNDAAFRVAAPPCELHAYATRLGIASASCPLSDSGYIRLENAHTVVLFDAAPIGPNYQPGHAHADTLSFELSHRGRRLVVNSGTSTYENSPERHRQRGTAAHNTICVDRRDSSEVWAAFRVGRRARPFAVSTDHRTWAEAAHDGYKPVIHRRRLELHSERLVVTDSIKGCGRHDLGIFFHLFPGADPNVIYLDPVLARSVEETTFHPQFDSSKPNQTLIGRWSGELPIRVTSAVCFPV
jgi:uncharacterized heparinase superfamily protein